MAKVEKSIEVDVPVSVAYGQWTQFEDFPQFMEGVVSVEQIDDAHLRWVAEVSGDRREWTADIVEQEPDRVIAWRSTEGPSGRVKFEPTDTGTEVFVEFEYEAEGLKEKVGALLGFDEGQVEEDLERFRDLVESRRAPTGEWRGEIKSGQVVEGDDSSY